MPEYRLRKAVVQLLQREPRLDVFDFGSREELEEKLEEKLFPYVMVLSFTGRPEADRALFNLPKIYLWRRTVHYIYVVPFGLEQTGDPIDYAAYYKKDCLIKPTAEEIRDIVLKRIN
jgi:hypothetical protein